MSRVLDLWAGMTGTVLPFAGASAPEGWLLCFGQAVSRSTFANLFAAIGTTFGAGDGSTTFNLPDLRGRVAAGKDDMGGTAANRITLARTGNTANASNQLTSVSSLTGLSVGMTVVGAGIPAGTTISSINTSTSEITLSANATATASGVAVRFGPMDGRTLGSAGGDVSVALVEAQMPSHIHPAYNQGNGGILNNGSTTYTTTQGNSNTTSTSVTLPTGGGQAHANVQPTIVLNSIIKT